MDSFSKKLKPQATEFDLKVGQRLRFRREQMGLSQTELANALGVTFQQIQKYESGKNRINLERLIFIASYLQIGVSYFFEDDVSAAQFQLTAGSYASK